MFAEIYAFFLLWAFTWPAIGMIVAAAIWCEHSHSHGWTVVYTIVLGAILWKMFALTPQQIGWGAALYFPIGFGWSFWRWKLHCDKIANEVDSGKYDKDLVLPERYGIARRPTEDEINEATKRAKENVRSRVFEQIDPRRHINKMVYWVVGWPFSLVERALSDLINFIETLIRTTMQQTYQRITNRVMARVDKMIDNKIKLQ